MSNHLEKSTPAKKNDPKDGILLDVGTNEVEFLLFEVSEKCFAVNVAKIAQIITFADQKIQPLPHQINGALGCILYRGEAISVFDLNKLLNLSPSLAPDSRKLLIVMSFNRKSYGFVVDRVASIERVSWANFSPVSHRQFFPGEPSIVGTIKTSRDIVHCIDFEAMMADLDPSQSVEEFGKKVDGSKTLDRGAIHLLYCEDSLTVRRMMMKVFAAAGFTNVHFAPTGAEGLNYLKSAEGRRVDLVLSDIEMPVMDGLTLCKNIKDNSNMSAIPVIFFSSLISEEMKHKCDSVRGDACFSKPEVDLVIPAIDRLILAKRAKA